jgi:hypothetical protein
MTAVEQSHHITPETRTRPPSCCRCLDPRDPSQQNPASLGCSGPHLRPHHDAAGRHRPGPEPQRRRLRHPPRAQDAMTCPPVQPYLQPEI